ncbi:MAG: hypothetical protein ABI592_03080 [Acidobacteriota bacterium]
MRNAFRAAALTLAIAFTAGAVLAAPAPEKMLTAAGNVSKVQASERAVSVAVSNGPETRFVWTTDTRINGTLAVGAKVTIRYTTLPDGQNLAHQISVAR